MDVTDANWRKVFEQWQRFPPHVREKFENTVDGCSPQQPAAEEVPATDTTSQPLADGEDAMEIIDPVT